MSTSGNGSIGGVTIGGPMSTGGPIGGSGNKSDIALLQSLLPGVHITSGGSVANIEALWAARNLKFSPLAVKAALLNDKLTFMSKEQIKVGLQTPLVLSS